MAIRESLPIDAVLPELLNALRKHPSVLLRAPTGAGKTTRVPPAILDSGLAGPNRILLLEPRRLAARAAARRMALERRSQVGEEIGFHVRFERQAGPRTRILAITPGILLLLLHDDPFLEKVGVIVFDEFHERALETDLALGMARLVQQTVRPELRLVVMSATLSTERLASFLCDAPVVTGEGRMFPVEIVYDPKPTQQPWPVAVASAVKKLLDQTSGDLLVFLPGLQEIRQTARQLEPLTEEWDLVVLPLHGDLPAEKQDEALGRLDRRKVVLATNVAETSVTVEGVTGVIDTGLARILALDPALGLDRLRVAPVSRSSADQRAGRAGRTEPGVCVRLWSQASHRLRPEQTEPEIRRVDLAGAVLQLLCWGEADVLSFPWLEPPPTVIVERALTLLQRLGALKDKVVTPLGRMLARLPVAPRLGRLLVEGQRRGAPERAALVAALLSDRDPFLRSFEKRGEERPRDPTLSNLLDRVHALEEFAANGRSAFAIGTLNRGAARFVLRARDQLLRLLRQETRKVGAFLTEKASEDEEEAVLRALLAAFPDRVARRRSLRDRRGVMVGGRGVRLTPWSSELESELFLCVDVDAGEKEAVVRQASTVRREWLSSEKMRVAVEIAFDPTEEKVTARQRVYYEDLALEESSAALPNDERTSQVLTEAALENLSRVLPPEDVPAGSFLTRVRCLRTWMPELNLPVFGEAELRELLPWLYQGRRSFAELRDGPWLQLLQGRLENRQLHAVEREAPERLSAPSGSRLALHYELGRPPVLAVRIQEMFGLRETPRVAGGRLRVLLHLLAPNYRPQQVTDDLASFWANTYPLIRKELRARYPKHAWPEDPWNATAERRPRRKR